MWLLLLNIALVVVNVSIVDIHYEGTWLRKSLLIFNHLVKH